MYSAGLVAQQTDAKLSNQRALFKIKVGRFWRVKPVLNLIISRSVKLFKTEKMPNILVVGSVTLQD